MNTVIVKLLNHSLNVGETLLVKYLLAPLAVFPAHPVKDDTAKRNIALYKLCGGLLDFFLRLVAFFGLNVRICPLGKHSGAACHASYSAYDILV